MILKVCSNISAVQSKGTFCNLLMAILLITIVPNILGLHSRHLLILVLSLLCQSFCILLLFASLCFLGFSPVFSILLILLFPCTTSIIIRSNIVSSTYYC